MTDMADVESVSEPSNNGKVLRVSQYSSNLFRISKKIVFNLIKYYNYTHDFLLKVISTCHWGNLLIWENGKIRLEFKRKDGSACHDGPINQIIADEGELITIGI